MGLSKSRLEGGSLARKTELFLQFTLAPWASLRKWKLNSHLLFRKIDISKFQLSVRCNVSNVLAALSPQAWLRDNCGGMSVNRGSAVQSCKLEVYPQDRLFLFLMCVWCSPLQSYTQAYLPPNQNCLFSFPDFWSPSALYIWLVDLLLRKLLMLMFMVKLKL